MILPYNEVPEAERKDYLWMADQEQAEAWFYYHDVERLKAESAAAEAQAAEAAPRQLPPPNSLKPRPLPPQQPWPQWSISTWRPAILRNRYFESSA